MSTGRLQRAARRGTDDVGLFVLCLALGVAELGLFLAAAAAIQGRQLPVTVAGVAGYRLLLIAALSAVLPACYAAYRDGATLRDTPWTAVAALRADGVAVLAGSLVARAVAALVTALVFAVLVTLVLGVDTLVVWTDAVFGVGVDRPTLVEWGVLAAALAAAWLVNGLVDYQDLLVIDDRAGWSGAWKASAWAVLARPRWYPWQALVRGLLLAAPWLLTILAAFALEAAGVGQTGRAPVSILLALGALFVLTSALGRATLVAYHVETAEAVVEPALDRPTPSRVNAGRIAVAAVVLLAAVGGVAAVRAGDVTPGPDVPDATLDPDDPVATVETAVRRTIRQSHARTEISAAYDAANDTWEQVARIDGRVDHARAAVTADLWYATDGDPIEIDLFATDGLAVGRGNSVGLYPNGPLQVRVDREPWIGKTGPSFDAMADDLGLLAPADGEGLSLRSANASTLVYVSDDPATFHDVVPRSYAPDPDEEDVVYRNGSEFRIVIDRDRGTLERVVKRVHFEDRFDEDDVDVIDRRSTITYRDVGETTVERPDSLGGPGPLETLWDVVYYA